MKFKNVIGKFVSGAFVIGLLMISNVFAAVTSETIKLGGNYSPTQRSLTRTLEYSYVSTKCVAVYPSSGEDTFTKIRAYLLSSDRTSISDVYILTEGNGYTSIKVKEGYLNTKYVYLNFTGNSSQEAWAHVSYDPN